METDVDDFCPIAQQLLIELYEFLVNREEDADMRTFYAGIVEIHLYTDDRLWGNRIEFVLGGVNDEHTGYKNKTINIVIDDGDIKIRLKDVDYKQRKTVFKYSLADPRCFNAVLTMVCKILKYNYKGIKEELTIKLAMINNTMDAIGEMERTENGKRRKYKYRPGKNN